MIYKMKTLSAFKKAIQGVAAIEFALLLPFLLLVVFGVYEITFYVEATRKLDNITNDIGYILSREGCIANDLNPNQPCTNSTIYTGGKTDLENIYDNVLPFLTYPLKYSSTDGTSQVEVKYVGMPVFLGANTSSCPGPAPYNSDGVNRQSLRVMWEHRYPPDDANGGAGVHVTNDNDITSLCSGDNCPGICNTTSDSSNRNLSEYSDTIGSRADIKYPGQSFIVINFAFDFKSLLGDNFPGVNFVLPHRIEKTTSYAIRSRWIDGADGSVPDRQIQTNELINSMQYCTDCNVYSSKFAPADGTNMNNPGTGPVVRQACKQPGDIGAVPSADNASSGCGLN